MAVGEGMAKLAELLGTLYPQPGGVQALLLRADIPLSGLPTQQGMTPVDWWLLVLHTLAAGAAEDDLQRLVAVAAADFPGNSALENLRHHGPPHGPAAGAPGPATAPPPLPKPLPAAITLLQTRRSTWVDGGFDAQYHACVAGTAPGALRAVRERLEDLDYLQQTATPGDPTAFQQIRLYLRFLYGAVLQWHHLQGLPLPASLTDDSP